MSIGERPGVYASYEVSGVSYSGTASGVAAVAAASISGEAGRVYEITSYAAAVSNFGALSVITELIRLLIKNGISVIKAVPLGDEPELEDYAAAFNALASDETVKVIACDSGDDGVHGALKTAIEETDLRARHKIGVVEKTGTVSEIVTAAESLNSERMVMIASRAVGDDGEEAAIGTLSAAFTGAVCSGTDPSLPLNGAELKGIKGIKDVYNDGDITLLIKGGVTPVEASNGEIVVIRGITTRTKTAGTYDPTYRELTTTLIIDDVLPTVRNALKAAFSRAKNNDRTRGAIRTRVIVELEKKLSAEIIDGYENVTVAKNAEDPTVCDVSFEFMVTHGLNQIRLTAYITV